jgi:hypothetical protein
MSSFNSELFVPCLSFCTLSIISAYGIARTDQNRSSFALAVACLSAILPGFVDIMTAVNDDVGAVAFFSIFLWMGVRLIIKGFDWLGLFLLLFAVIQLFGRKTQS